MVTPSLDHLPDKGRNTPIPLADPSGHIRGYCCPICFRIKNSMYAGGPKGLERELQGMKETAETCGRCRACGRDIHDDLPGFYSQCRECRAKEEAEWQARMETQRPERERKAALREAALGQALDRDAAEVLYQLMHNLSETTYAAGWMMGLEEALWGMVEGGPREYGMGKVYEFQVNELRRLAEKCGGWWVWREELDGETFTPLAEWKAEYAKRDAR